MLDCCNGHHTYVVVKAIGPGGISIADSSNMTLDQVIEIVEDMLIGECPVCTGKIQ